MFLRGKENNKINKKFKAKREKNVRKISGLAAVRSVKSCLGLFLILDVYVNEMIGRQ